MKKKICYLLAVFFLAFAWMTTVAAGAPKYLERSHTFKTLGEEYPLALKNVDYPNLNCPTQTPKGHGVIKKVDEYGKNEKPTGRTLITITYASEVTEKENDKYVTVEDSVECSFNVRGTTDEVGKVKFNLKFEPLKKESTGVVTLRGRLTDGMIDRNSKLHELYYMDEIISSEITSSGEYINLDCKKGSKECIVTGKQATYEETQTETVVVKYKKYAHPEYEYIITITVKVNYTGSARAYYGKDYTCGFNSDWKPFSKTYADTGQQVAFYYALKNDIVFPTCQPNNDYSGIAIHFAGWTTNPNVGNAQKMNRCLSDPNSRFLAAGPQYVGDAARNWYSCFEYEDFVGLRTSLGTLSGDTSGWSEFAAAGMDYIKYQHGEVTLPSVDFKEDGVSFGGWVCTGYAGKLDAGAKVKSGTTCSATKNREYVYTALNKTVYVGRTLTIAVSDRKITSCSVTSGSNVSVESADGTCVVTGVSESETPNDVKVVFEHVDGKDDDRTYKVTVQNLENMALDFVIAAPIQGVASHIEGDGVVFAGSNCGSYTAGEDKSHASVEGVEESVYSVRSNCGDNSYYASLCLDPDRHGPQGEPYERAENIRAGTPLGLVLQRVVEIIADDPSLSGAFTTVDASGKLLEFRIAAQVSMRVVGIATNTYVQSPDLQGFSGNDYAKYEAAAKAFNNISAKASASEIESGVKSALSHVYSEHGSSFNYAVDILSFVKKNLTGGSDTIVTIQREIDSGYPQVADVGDNSYKIKYKGKLKVPKSMKVKGIQKCGSNSLKITCYSASIGAATSGESYDTYEYEVVIGTDDALNMKIPTTSGEKMSVAFEIITEGASIGDSFVINPTGGGSNGMIKQRMVVFTYTDNSLFMYFSPIPPECLTELTALKAANCSESDCSSFNQALFKAAKCCNLVANESIPNYNYLINNVCSAKCTTSTMEPVCNYENMVVDESELETRYDADGNPYQVHKNFGRYDLYQIHEGAYMGDSGWELNLSSTPDGGGACVVNVVETKNAYYQDNGGYVRIKDKDSFITKDDLGNSRALREYNENKFCQITCKEDFDLTMGAYGNYMGPDAVRAGSHFTMDDTKIYMYGAFSCYSTYIHYEDYGHIQSELSHQIVQHYDLYASWNHAATDVMERKPSGKQPEYKLIIQGGDISYCESYTWNPEDPDSKSEDVLCKKDEDGKRPSSCDADGDGKNDSDLTETVVSYSRGYWQCNSATAHVPTHSDYMQGTRYDDPQDPGPGQYEEFTDSGVTSGIGGMTVKKAAADYADPSMSYNCHVTPGSNGGDGASDIKSTSFTQEQPSTKPGGAHVSCDYESWLDKYTDWDTIQKVAHDKMAPIEQQTAGDISDGHGKTVNALSSELHENAKHFYYCQHFGVYTQRIGDAGAAAAAASDNGTGQDKTSGIPVSPKVIGADFNPTAYYSYDEKQYMTTVGADNFLVRDDATNQSLSGNADYGKPNSTPSITTGSDNSELNVTLSSGSTYEQVLYNNYSEERYCKVSSPWVANSKEAKTYGEGSASCSSSRPPVKQTQRIMCMSGHFAQSGHMVDGKDGPFFVADGHAHWVDGKCFPITITYQEANYIMKSVKNSSFYVNKGFWWNGPENTRIHGDYLFSESYGELDKTRQEMQAIYGYSYGSAVDKYNSIYRTQIDAKQSVYSMIGNFYNVFPVSMTTARGLYAYTYQFANIGTYFGQATLGRLMGNPESIVAVNSRTCFYEVYEEICGCCGDPIEYHTAVLEGSGSDVLTEQIREEHDDSYPTSTGVSTSYSGGQSNATLNFFTTVSSLSDLSAITDTGSSRKLANNWGESFFSYASNDYLVTRKGEDAKLAVEANSDVVYTKTPEYSFELTPQVIQTIREYNTTHDYDIKTSNLTSYGTYTIVPMSNCSSAGSCKWTEGKGHETVLTYNNSNFTHYGSNFLATVVYNAASPETQARLNNENICDSTSVDVSNYESTLGCRWVDYIETDAYNGARSKKLDSVCSGGKRYDINTDSCISANYYRLAFK